MRPSVKNLLVLLALTLAKCAPAFAGPMNSPLAADRCAPMGDVVAATVLDLAPMCANSWKGSGQTFSNMELTPADSSAQTYYDFFFGAASSVGSDDQTPVGYAGHKGTYFSYDGGDQTRSQAGASPTSFFADMHRTNTTQKWGAWFAFRFVQIDLLQYFFGTSASAAVGGYGFESTATEDVAIRRNDGGVLSDTQTIYAGGSLVNGTDYIVFYTMNNATKGYTAWLYTPGTSVSKVSGTLLSTLDATAINASTGTFSVCTANTSASRCGNGTRFYGFGAINDALDDTSVAAIVAQIEIRTGIDFTP